MRSVQGRLPKGLRAGVAAGSRWTLLAGLAFMLAACAGSGQYQWGWYLLDPRMERGAQNLRFLLTGAGATLQLSLTAILISIALGLAVALIGLARPRLARMAGRAYVEGFRAIPMLVLLLWVYYGLPVALGVQLGVFWAGVLTLALSDSAFEAEVFRAGIQAVPRGQLEAAQTLGFSSLQRIRYIILPQAVRTVLPALGNQFIYVLKMSSLISVIGFQELTRRANELNVTEYRPLEIYSFLVIEYLILILLVSWLVRWVERRGSGARAR